MVSGILHRRNKGSNETRFFQRLVSAVLVDGLETTSADTDTNILAELRNPDTLGAQVGLELALDGLGHVTTNTTLFLGFTTTMNPAT